MTQLEPRKKRLVQPAVSPAGPSHVIPLDRDEQLITRAAWLYFVAGLTQDEVGKQLGLTRLRVNRLLAQSREQGIVQIRINSRLASCVALEQGLKQRFGLDEAVVVPTPPDAASIPPVIGAAAGAVLGDRLRDGMAVGVGWGRTLRLSLQSVPRQHLPNLTVVSLLGGLMRGSVINTYETASHLADILGAQCYYIAGPALTDTQATRDILMDQAILREAFSHARQVDLALISVGTVAPDATMVAVGLIEKKDLKSLVAAGATGDLCAHWIDDQGALVDHPLNRRAIAISPDELRAIDISLRPPSSSMKAASSHGL